jgi:hypothetical protein
VSGSFEVFSSAATDAPTFSLVPTTHGLCSSSILKKVTATTAQGMLLCIVQEGPVNMPVVRRLEVSRLWLGLGPSDVKGKALVPGPTPGVTNV